MRNARQPEQHQEREAEIVNRVPEAAPVEIDQPARLPGRIGEHVSMMIVAVNKHSLIKSLHRAKFLEAGRGELDARKQRRLENLLKPRPVRPKELEEQHRAVKLSRARAFCFLVNLSKELYHKHARLRARAIHLVPMS